MWSLWQCYQGRRNYSGMILSELWHISILKIKGKFKFMANCRDTAENISSIDGTAVPCLSSFSTCSGDEIGCIVVIILCNGKNFVELMVNPFNDEGWMTTLCQQVISDVQCDAHCLQ